MRQGNDSLLKEYEEQQQQVKLLKVDETKVKNEIQKLTHRINSIDVQMQQEPDPKYDTLVKMAPFFKHVTEELLKQKRCLIETEMQRQLNVMLNSYRNHIERVDISESLDNFTIKIRRLSCMLQVMQRTTNSFSVQSSLPHSKDAIC